MKAARAPAHSLNTSSGSSTCPVRALFPAQKQKYSHAAATDSAENQVTTRRKSIRSHKLQVDFRLFPQPECNRFKYDGPTGTIQKLIPVGCCFSHCQHEQHWRRVAGLVLVRGPDRTGASFQLAERGRAHSSDDQTGSGPDSPLESFQGLGLEHLRSGHRRPLPARGESQPLRPPDSV